MKNEKQSFVFFGSGPVAKKNLELLLDNFIVEAIITKPSTERDMHSIAGSTPVYGVKNRQELDKLIQDENFISPLGVLIDFGIIVSQEVIDAFPLGIVNSHFSLLPELRGADPISFAILEDKKRTGVSLMLLVEAMDEGPLLAVGIEELQGDETTPNLTNRLVNLSTALLVSELPRYINGESLAVTQEEYCLRNSTAYAPSYSRKLTKEDGQLDWQKTATQLEREIRAFAEWPKSYTTFGDIDVVVTKAHVGASMDGDVGSLIIEGKKLSVICNENVLVIDELKPAGKKSMNTEAFLAGYRQRLSV